MRLGEAGAPAFPQCASTKQTETSGSVLDLAESETSHALGWRPLSASQARQRSTGGDPFDPVLLDRPRDLTKAEATQ
jgi:hypothetical protein